MKEQLIILDGGMGTDLQHSGLKPGENPAVYGMTHAVEIRDIHMKYIKKGTNCIYTNTFGASGNKLKGSGYSVDEVVQRNVETAVEAVRLMREQGRECMVALDVGPLGELLEPLGTLPFEEAYRAYAEIVEAGEKAGADLVVFETFTDLYEMKAAVLAAKEHSNLPIWSTMSFEANGRTFLGTSAAAMALTLEGLGVAALGINCSLGPKEILPIAESMMEWTNLPMIIKPNAGLPDPRTGEYDITAEEFAEEMVPFLEKGVGIVGGCCGTNTDFIRALSHKSSHYNPAGRIPKSRNGVCSAGSVAEYGKLNIIGERINPTGKKKLQQALRDGDMDYIKKLAVEQYESGAQILDVNVGAPGVDEVALMPKVVQAVQSVTDIPLQLDSVDPEVLRAGLRVVNGRPIVNSVNGERERLDSVLPLVADYGTAVLGLAMDEDGIPEDAEGRIQGADSSGSRSIWNSAGRRDCGLSDPDGIGPAGAGAGDAAGSPSDSRRVRPALCFGRQQHLLRPPDAAVHHHQFPHPGDGGGTGFSDCQYQREGDSGCRSGVPGAERGGCGQRKLHSGLRGGRGGAESETEGGKRK